MDQLEQGSDEWLAARLGMMTASEMKLIITPGKLQYASNDKERSHLYELLAQRITGYVEPHYVSDDMLRGHVDEIEARNVYNAELAPCRAMGFMTNDKWGFTLGYSPDALVGDDGQIECKSRRQKYQIETILSQEVPTEYLIQIQTGLLVSERAWCDLISYSGGLPMVTLRVFPDRAVQGAILDAAAKFEEKLAAMMGRFHDQIANPLLKMVPTERNKFNDVKGEVIL